MIKLSRFRAYLLNASERKFSMKFFFNRRASLNTFVLAGLLATAGTCAIAQANPAPPGAGPNATVRQEGSAGHHMERHDPAKMQAGMAKRQADMKAKLKITPAQEGAWTSYTAAMQPPAHARPTPDQRAEFDKLPTPERIDKMKALRAQHMTEMNTTMDKRGDATKALYAALSQEQQKLFDAEYAQHRHQGDHHGMQNHDGGKGASPQKR